MTTELEGRGPSPDRGGQPDRVAAGSGARGSAVAGSEGGRRSWWREHSELGICAVLVALGGLVLVDAIRIPTDFAQRGPVGPKAVPVVVGVGLLLVAALLARDVLKGGRGEAEGGEDVDLAAPADWRTVLLLCGAFLANAALIGVVGFPISGAVLFWGAAYALGSRHVVRDPLIAAGLSLLTFFLFNDLLGVPLPGGPLVGVL
ncbi:tripartite tricarboxylate transporter TctB family protein [Saccharothrix variisporea]|uniref:Putative tricarboxylic transport membrane protein n=1 Tax=Saccharothrix variisporea TaxID=543527 RepID=A0A495XG91_9PSEU|nr:tripartite tricarboxylate transporter TctB family protein [Saccharothrix variisporea]RKT71814.1 putative tricarboxylic transport membrane protein [Saccharothrix variisporea]